MGGYTLIGLFDVNLYIKGDQLADLLQIITIYNLAKEEVNNLQGSIIDKRLDYPPIIMLKLDLQPGQVFKKSVLDLLYTCGAYLIIYY